MIRGNIGTKLRTPETWDRYCNKPKNNGCFMCTASSEPIRVYDKWMIIDNDFPYDAVTETHHMLVPVNHVRYEEDLTIKEIEELTDILGDLEYDGFYDCILRNFTSAQSHPAHLHYHLIKWIRTG